MAILGASGSGKTTLAKALLQSIKAPIILVIDPKCTYGGIGGETGYEMIRKPKHLWRLGKKHTRIQYRPSIEHQNVEGYDEVYEWAYRTSQKLHDKGQKQTVLVYTDETFQTMRGTKAPDWQRNAITCGRELGMGMIFASQRPRGIDPRVLTECESMACFHLRKHEDRKAVADAMGDEVMTVPPKFAFWWVRDGIYKPRLARLEIGK
jgi:ABC-type dipeptide/oligopeptide/nickel transport system ATPase component